jgi:hypothetical protein
MHGLICLTLERVQRFGRLHHDLTNINPRHHFCRAKPRPDSMILPTSPDAFLPRNLILTWRKIQIVADHSILTASTSATPSGPFLSSSWLHSAKHQQ